MFSEKEKVIMKYEDEDEFGEEEFDGFIYEDDVMNKSIEDMTDEEMDIWLKHQPFYYRIVNKIGKLIGYSIYLKEIIVYLLWILFYNIIKTSLYRNIYLFIAILGAILYWIFMFGSEGIQVLDAEDDHVIFELHNI